MVVIRNARWDRTSSTKKLHSVSSIKMKVVSALSSSSLCDEIEYKGFIMGKHRYAHRGGDRYRLYPHPDRKIVSHFVLL